MKIILFVLIILFQAENITAQAIIKGAIKDETGLPVQYASAGLIDAADSTLIRGSLSDENGMYLIENITSGRYRILASFLGYDHVYSDVFELKPENKSATVDISFLSKGILLDETVILAKRPFLEQKADRLVVNVASSAVAAGGTAMEILQKVPGVVIIQDKVTMGGSQNLQVWVDGKPSPYTDMNTFLRDMPGDQIDKIELITQPGAQFDAAGGPILNIVLKRNADLGFKGTAALTIGGSRYDQSDVGADKENFYRINPSVNLTYRNGKINLFGNTSYNQGNYFDVFIINRYIGQDVYKSNNIDRTDYSFRNIRIGADYFVTDKTTVGTVLRTWSRMADGKSFNKTNVFDQTESILYTTFNTENVTDSRRSGVFSNIYYKFDFDRKTGHSFNADLDYNLFNTTNINDLTIYPDDSPQLKSLSRQAVDQPVNIIVGKADYKLPIDSSFTPFCLSGFLFCAGCSRKLRKRAGTG
ncbi:MAG: carboxypeptidase regulatory-like domain-containing protein [Saprospiraceae bacterium]|nr:carboxypeptidase regulatory-like domain-containing protein [Saprospiraceae bacterium]